MIENKILNFEELNIGEKNLIDAFILTNYHCKLHKDYYFGTYAESHVCMIKNNENWEIYVAERGITHKKKNFNNCLDACICLIEQCCDSNTQCIEAIKYFKNMVEKNTINNINDVLDINNRNKGYNGKSSRKVKTKK